MPDDSAETKRGEAVNENSKKESRKNTRRFEKIYLNVSIAKLSVKPGTLH
jgi:hypothetical protein